jgi:hypothetical protein
MEVVKAARSSFTSGKKVAARRDTAAEGVAPGFSLPEASMPCNTPFMSMVDEEQRADDDEEKRFKGPRTRKRTRARSGRVEAGFKSEREREDAIFNRSVSAAERDSKDAIF